MTDLVFLRLGCQFSREKHRVQNPLKLKSVTSLGLLVIALTLSPVERDQGEFCLGNVRAAVSEKESDITQVVEFGTDDPRVLATMAIQDNYTDALLAEPGIVGTATGATEDGKLAIFVYARSYESAQTATIPDDIEGVPVVVQITGDIVSLNEMAARGEDGNDWWPRPVPIGVSTGHPDFTAGTIGCRVTDGNNVYALSTNQVYAHENAATIGDDALQPGAFDGGSTPTDVIGALSAFQEIDFSPGAENVIDAAIVETTEYELDSSTPRYCYGRPRSRPHRAKIGMKVMKCGRTTGLTESKISAINATVTVGYESGDALFVDQIIISPGSFSSGGDQGSLVVKANRPGKRRPVGLLSAKSETITIVNPIRAVLDRFGVTIDNRR